MSNKKTAPDFTLIDQYGTKFNLYSSLKTNKIIMLVFYPKDNTPVCTKQLCEYSGNWEQLAKKGILPVAINTGSLEQHQEFSFKYGFRFQLLADQEKKVCKMYNALNFIGMVKRRIVLIDETHKIIFENSRFPFLYLGIDEILGLNL